MNYRFATATDLDRLAEWNRQLIEDEGHSNSMSIAQLRDRMRNWLYGEYRAVVFSIEDDDFAYALYSEDKSEIYLRQFFVVRNRRRRGIGRNCVEVLRNQIWPPTKRLTVDVLVRNAAGAEFWRSTGFLDYCLTLEIPCRADPATGGVHDSSLPSD